MGFENSHEFNGSARAVIQINNKCAHGGGASPRLDLGWIHRFNRNAEHLGSLLNLGEEEQILHHDGNHN